MAELSNELSIPRALRLFQRKKLAGVCPAGTLVGDCVYVYGPRVGSSIQVQTTNASTETMLPVVGVVTAKSAPTVCTVQILGEVPGLYTGLTPGARLYVGSSGQPSHTPGLIPQVIGVALDTNLVLLTIDTDRGASNYKTGRPLLPTVDPRVYTTEQPFQHSAGGVTIELFHNGRRLAQMPAVPSPQGEYFVAESNPGFGFDEVHLTSFTPSQSSRLEANYFV